MKPLTIMTPAEVERACRDLGWHILYHPSVTSDDGPQHVVQIIAGTAPDALIIGCGTSSVSVGQAVLAAWRAACDAMGMRLAVRTCGAVSWDGADFTMRDRWYQVDEPPGEAPG
ncbi:MAG: hypothetical protein M3Y37_09620 [Chloroflexota bacterium]|nr:hypothetical protein [Chloroflexota bacterium]